MKSAPTASEHRPVYLDSSAILKLIFIEDETDALDAFLREWPRRTASSLARVEVMRMAMRVEDVAVTATARDVLARIDMVAVDESTLFRALAAEPRTLRSADAIHLATAIALQPDIAGLVAYDKRLAAAARSAGLRVWAPS
jgi:uncharacterized protein